MLSLLFALGVCFCVVVGESSQLDSGEAVPKHVVLFVMDDVGYSDIGTADMQTPYIDHLMETGLALDKLYTQPVCSPSRSALLTGLYPHHTGMQLFNTIVPASAAATPLSVPLLSEMLAASHTSHMVGKWHLGYAKWEYTPSQRGFKSFRGYMQGMEDYFLHNFSIPNEFLPGDVNGYDYWDSQSPDWGARGQYFADLFDSHAAEAIETFASINAKAKEKKGLFLYLAHQVAHIPNEAPPAQFAKKYNRTAEYKRCKELASAPRASYCQMMLRMDVSVELAVSQLKETGLWEQSIFVLVTDNGGVPDYGAFPRGCGCNYPLRAGKGRLFEGGVRGKALFHGGLLPNKLRQTATQHLMHLVDIVPTVLDVIDVSPSAVLDGRSMLPIWLHQVQDTRQSIPLNLNYHLEFPSRGVQAGVVTHDGFKLVIERIEGATFIYDGYFLCNQTALPAPENEFDGYWLFDLNADPYEEKNLFGSNKQKAAELLGLLDEFRKTYVPPQKNMFRFAGLPELHNNTWAPFLEDNCTLAREASAEEQRAVAQFAFIHG